MPPRSLAVCLHDVEPATYERVALIRDWLADLGVARLTLLVIPARDLHPLGDRSPALAGWLAERVTAGDRVAQHGFHHGAAEFARLDEQQARRSVLAGRRVLRLAGIEPSGFVAEDYAYPPALRRAVAASFPWFASAHRLHLDAGRRVRETPSLTIGSGSRAAGALRPLAARWRGRPLRRLELHPAALDDPRSVGRVERLLHAASRASAAGTVTLDELAAAA